MVLVSGDPMFVSLTSAPPAASSPPCPQPHRHSKRILPTHVPWPVACGPSSCTSTGPSCCGYKLSCPRPPQDFSYLSASLHPTPTAQLANTFPDLLAMTWLKFQVHHSGFAALHSADELRI
jgi:hypothetical protein